MKKIFILLLVLFNLFAAFPAFAAPVVISYDFEAFKNEATAQDTSAWTWITFNQWETAWVTARFKETDTYIEPADRTDAVGGTAMRIYTNDGVMPYSASSSEVFLNRPRGVSATGVQQEIWFSFDWMLEDLNSDHKILMYLDNVSNIMISIDTSGALSTLAGKTGVIINPGEWNTYEICMSKTQGLLFYLNGNILNTLATKTDGTIWRAQSNLLFYQKLQNNGDGYYKGSGMQIDNFVLTVLESERDKKLCGISGYSFNVEGETISFEALPYNLIESDIPYLIILNVYDENGVYLGYGASEGIINPGDSSSQSAVRAQFEKWDGAWRAKAYILKGWTDRTAFSNNIFTYPKADE